MHLDPSPYCLPALFSCVGTSFMDVATRQSQGVLELCLKEDVPMILSRFTPFSFYTRSLLSLVRRACVGWKMQGKANRSNSDSRKGGRERRTERTLDCTKCAMVVFPATSVWHMPHVFVRVRNIVHPTWHERSWLCASNDLYV